MSKIKENKLPITPEFSAISLTIYSDDDINFLTYSHKMLYPKDQFQTYVSLSPNFVGTTCRAAAMVTSETGGPAVSRKKILIVEDNDLSMKLVNDLLEFQGYQVLQAARGADAVRMAHDASPDLILLNMQLPDISGLEVARTLKADNATRAIPIVAVTAFALRGDEQKARESGCDGYIAKPIRIQLFLRTVETFLHARS